MADGNKADTLEIEIEASSDEAIKKLNALIGAFHQLKTASSDFSATLKNAVSGFTSVSKIKGIEKIESVAKQINDLKKSEEKVQGDAGENLSNLSTALSQLQNVKISKTLPENFDKLAKSVQTIREGNVQGIQNIAQGMVAIAQVPNMTKAIKQLGKFPEVLENLNNANISGIADKMKELAAAMQPLADQMKKIYDGFSSLPGSIRDFVKNYKVDHEQPTSDSEKYKVPKDVDSGPLEDLKTKMSWVAEISPKFSAALSAASYALNIFKKTANGAGTVLKFFGKAIFGDIAKYTHSAVKAFSSWKNAIGRVAFYRIVRSAIKMIEDGFREGTENLYKYSRAASTEFAPAMDKLATSALYLKNSVGAMAAPLIQAVAPAVDFLIDKFVVLLNTIGKVFAALTGKSSYSQAIKFPTEYGEAASGAAKAIKDFTIGIDELNIISDKAGSGGGSGLDFGSMFEEVEIDQDKFDWAKQIQDAIKNGEWYRVGKVLADKLNEVVDNWDAVQWGESLGRKITNGLTAVYGFMKTFNFERIGVKAANLVNGLFDKVDFDLVGRTLATKWNALADTIYGFVTTAKWDEIGSAISDSVNGWFSEINWARAGQTISKSLEWVLKGIITFVRKTDWMRVGKSIWLGLQNIDWENLLGDIGTLIGEALAAGIEVFFSDPVAVLKIGWAIVKGIAKGIVNAFSAFTDSIVNTVESTLDGISYVRGSRSFEKLESTFMSSLDGIENGSEKKWRNIRDISVDAISDINKTSDVQLQETQYHFESTWGEIQSGSDRSWNNIKNNISSSMSGIRATVSSGTESTKTIFSTNLNALKTTNQSTWSNIKNTTSNTWRTMEQESTGIFGNIKTSVINIWNSIRDGLKQPLNDILGYIDSLVSQSVSGINQTIDSVNSFSSSISTPGKGSISEIPKIRKGTIKRYAEGGIVDQGELFIAKERGPELVGRIGSKTGVANTNQIVTAVQAGVYQAVRAAMSEQTTDRPVNVRVELDGKTIYTNQQQVASKYGYPIGLNPNFV